MAPARFPHAPHILAPESQTACSEHAVMEHRAFTALMAGGLLAAPLAGEARSRDVADVSCVRACRDRHR